MTSMTSIAADIDPTVEKAIRRCLDPDPGKRPATALSVAAALPGGDPLAAALAAGETPSPELVAAAGNVEGLAYQYSIPCLVVVVVCLVATTALRARYCVIMHTALDDPPDVLAHQAREIAASFGYTKRPADSDVWIWSRDDLLEDLKRVPGPGHWDDWLASEAPIMASYREGTALLQAEPYGRVSWRNPPPVEPGMIEANLDGAGRLREFSAVPYNNAANSCLRSRPGGLPCGCDSTWRRFTKLRRRSRRPMRRTRWHSWKGPHPQDSWYASDGGLGLLERADYLFQGGFRTAGRHARGAVTGIPAARHPDVVHGRQRHAGRRAAGPPQLETGPGGP